MKTVCLIIPPSVFLLDERVFMSLGILRVAAMLERAGHTVEMLDLSGIANHTEVVRLHARASRATHFGLTATTPQMPATFAIAQALREVRPDATLLLGGPHITLVSASRKMETREGRPGRGVAAFDKLAAAFDVLVAGDGEFAVERALADAPPAFIDGDDPKSDLFLKSAQLKDLPFPARHLVDVNSYRYTIEGVKALSLIAQLGCPFECGFCGGRFSPMLRRARMRDPENVVAEIEHLHRTYGTRAFMLYDDELNVNPRMVDLLNMITDLQKRLGVEFKLRGFIKSQLFNDAQAEAMVRAGFRWILTGFESGSPRILQNINKRATLEENSRCVAIAKRHGLKVKALMSIGHPGESPATVGETESWLLSEKPDDFDLTIITTYPGTPYYDKAVLHEKGRDGRSDVWVYTYAPTGDRLFAQEVDYTTVADYYKGRPDGGYKSYVHTDHLSADDIVAARDRIEHRVRAALGIPFNPSAEAVRYEHSMGQGVNLLPPSILRRTADAGTPRA